MKATALIVNPFASAVDGRRIEAVRAALGDPQLLLTEGPGHATELTRSAEAWAETIYLFSGDGGFNEAVNGASGRVPLGFVPGGGTSVLPRALGLPRDPVAAARLLAAGRRQRISLGRANGRRFAFSCGIGIDADAVRRIEARGRRPDGKRPGDVVFALTLARLILTGAYAEPALEVGRTEDACVESTRSPFQAPVEPVEGACVESTQAPLRAAFALVGNLAPYTYAGRIGIRPHPPLTPAGGLDLVAPERFRLRSLPRFAAYVLRGRGADHAPDLVYAHDLDRLAIRCDRPLPLQLDGEDLGDVTEVLLESERDALTVLI